MEEKNEQDTVTEFAQEQADREQAREGDLDEERDQHKAERLTETSSPEE